MNIRPGDSIVGGIEAGLAEADVFVLVWSAAAHASNWVGTEVRAFLRRRVDDQSLRIVPLIVDGTELPILVADYRGFDLTAGTTLEEVAQEMTGHPRDVELAMRLQKRLLEITEGATGGDMFPYLVCPTCGSAELKRGTEIDYKRDETYYTITCQDCGWSDWTQ